MTVRPAQTNGVNVRWSWGLRLDREAWDNCDIIVIKNISRPPTDCTAVSLIFGTGNSHETTVKQRSDRDRAYCRAMCWWAGKVEFGFTYIMILPLGIFMIWKLIVMNPLRDSGSFWDIVIFHLIFTYNRYFLVITTLREENPELVYHSMSLRVLLFFFICWALCAICIKPWTLEQVHYTIIPKLKQKISLMETHGKHIGSMRDT